MSEPSGVFSGAQAGFNGAAGFATVQQSLADLGGISLFVQATAPTGTIPHDSIWIDTANGSLNTWNGSAWIEQTFNATNIIQASTIIASLIEAGTITATQLAAGIIVAGIVNGTTITGAQIISDGIGKEFLVYNGAPTAGNLTLSVSSTAFIDSFGNSVLEGFTTYFNLGGSPGSYAAINTNAQTITFYKASTEAGPWINGARLFYNQDGSTFDIDATVNPGITISMLTAGAPINLFPGTGFNVFGITNSNQIQGSLDVGPNGLSVTGGTTTDTLTVSEHLTATSGTPSDPTLIQTDTWHNPSPSITGWTFSLCRYKLFPDNTIHIQIKAATTSSAASGTVGLFTLPSDYIPANEYRGCAPGMFGGIGNTRFQVTTSGGVNFLGWPGGSSASETDGYWIVPLD